MKDRFLFVYGEETGDGDWIAPGEADDETSFPDPNELAEENTNPPDEQ